jgi:hypothetical protein
MTAANPLGFQKLLDFNVPVDVDLVESTVNIFYGAGAQDQVTSASFPVHMSLWLDHAAGYAWLFTVLLSRGAWG